MTQASIGFIGGGNMARSLIGGLIADHYPNTLISVSEPDAATRGKLAAEFSIQTVEDNQQLASSVDVLVLAVKPQMMKQVTEAMRDSVQAKHPLVVSIAAGIRAESLDAWLGGNVALVRTMPNTPSLVGSGAAGLYANALVSEAQKATAESILRAVGLTLWVKDETQIDHVTALSGSGPAYFFLILEALEAAGTKLGLPQESARLLALQTAYGAAKMALESPEDAATLRQRVTSPGGTTEQALKVLEEGKIRELFEQALTAASQRSAELADMLGEK
ncbi:MAG: pyrroline-5-carboxylate reductase [Gammaproteobacteria bacterium]|nr:pyrroline-5-carboxylate reductase [Gammaproteobacteria bacterium]